MKKLITLVLSLVLAANSYAQLLANGVGVMTGEAVNGTTTGSKVLWGVKKVFNTPIKLSGKVIASCLASKRVCTGIAAGSISFAYLYEHPEVVDDFLRKNPEKTEEVNAYLTYRANQAKDEESKEKYLNAQQELALDKTLQDQLDLEDEQKHPEFKDIMDQLALEASKIDSKILGKNGGNKPQCSMARAEELFKKSEVFSKSTNIGLPKNNDGTYNYFNVDKYANLQAKLGAVERDHIPSYKAMEVFFKTKEGLGQLTTVKLLNQPLKSKSNRFTNLDDNLTAMNVSRDTHVNGRTNNTRNQTLAQIDGASSKALFIATLKDFATILWYEKFIKNDSTNYIKYFDRFSIVYERNKRMCLYDL